MDVSGCKLQVTREYSYRVPDTGYRVIQLPVGRKWMFHVASCMLQVTREYSYRVPDTGFQGIQLPVGGLQGSGYRFQVHVTGKYRYRMQVVVSDYREIQ
jgi:hypothetical protein